MSNTLLRLYQYKIVIEIDWELWKMFKIILFCTRTLNYIFIHLKTTKKQNLPKISQNKNPKNVFFVSCWLWLVDDEVWRVRRGHRGSTWRHARVITRLDTPRVQPDDDQQNSYFLNSFTLHKKLQNFYLISIDFLLFLKPIKYFKCFLCWFSLFSMFGF